MLYKNMCNQLKKLKEIRLSLIENRLKSYMSKTTLLDKNKVEVIEIFKDEDKEEFAVKVNKGDEYYYYVGPLDEKNRTFCRYVLVLDKVFRREDIDWMTANLGYDVFKYEGSYGCRHKWVRFRGKEIQGTLPTDKQIDRLINDQVDDGFEQ